MNTTKLYYEPKLLETLDKAIERQKKGWDNNIIIDGEEGSGKTTFSWGIGLYLAQKTNRSFDLSNIFFDAEKMMRFAADTRKQIIIWDEAALEGLATNWQSKIQKKLIKILMTARKNGHFFIFNIPKFYKLTEYIAVDRSIILFHIYSPDNITRGYFTAYNRKKKEYFYERYRAARKKPYGDFTYRGTFPKSYATIIPEEEYDKKKDKAIASVLDDDDKKASKTEIKLKQLQYKVCKLTGITKEDIAKQIGVSPSTLYSWGHLEYKKPLNRGGNQENRSISQRTNLITRGKGGLVMPDE